MPQEIKGRLIVRDTLVNGEYALPHLDGTNGDVLMTDGNGVVSWKNPLGEVDGGFSNSIYLTEQLIDGGNA
jgi:hypothetical protein